MTFTIIDAAIIFIYLMGMLVLGFIMGKTNKTQEDYFVAKRSLPWLPIGLSIAATMISCNSFVGGPGWGYHSGLLPFMQNMTVPLALFISTTIFVPMHFSEDYEGGNALRSFAENAGCRFISITHRGESFEITK